MKRIAIAVVVGSTLAVLAGSATAERIGLSAKSTYAESHPVNNAAGTAFPSSVDEFGIVRLGSMTTYADQHRSAVGDKVQSAIPQSVDEAGIHLPPMPASLQSEASQAN